MTIDELLNELDTFPRQGIQSYDGALAVASGLMRAAAVTIRQLRTTERDDEPTKQLILEWCKREQ
jgi:hypothetical protein